jgi:molybdopterin biosynthesis enzyme
MVVDQSPGVPPAIAQVHSPTCTHLTHHPCCSLVSVCSWSLPALEAGLTAALPALALVAVQELGPWAKLPDQQQYARYVQLLEEVNESQLVNQTDL